jgi:hypothetical protein
MCQHYVHREALVLVMLNLQALLPEKQKISYFVLNRLALFI